MSSSSQIIAYYSTGSHTETALVVHGCSFAELLARASDAFQVNEVSIVYNDDEGEPVAIASQAELDEAFLQHNNRLVCRLSSRQCPPPPPLFSPPPSSPSSPPLFSPPPSSPSSPPPPSSIPKNVRKQLASSSSHFSKTKLIVLFAIVSCLIAAIAIFISMPTARSTTGESCPNLIQLWSSAIESGMISDDSAPATSIYNLLNTCPRDLALYWIGRYEYAQGNVCDALERFRSASKLNPSHAGSHLWTGRSLKWLEQPADALKAFAAAAHLAPYLADAQFEFGRALTSADDVAAAAFAAIGAAVSTDPNHDEARLLKGRLAYERGDNDSAYSEFSILVARHPNSAEYRIWKRRVFDNILQER